jgi:uncharacterized membrane protein (UPF0127 family)
MRRQVVAGAALLLAAGVALSPMPVAAATLADCPSTGLKTQKLVLETASGKHHYTLEIAATEPQQQCGLMFRKTMKANHGMVFPMNPPRRATFWMENTVLPLDLIFVGPDERVLSIAVNAKPFSRDILDAGGLTSAVIELNAGEAARIGLQAGDRVVR